MKEREVVSAVDYPESLNRPPHVLSQLIGIITAELQSSSDNQEQRWKHLAGCIYCQAFLGDYLLGIMANKEEFDLSTGAVRDLFSRLTRIMHQTIERDIPAYVEILVEQSAERAKRCFPLLSEHLQTCQDCRAAVRDLRKWLQQVEQARTGGG